MSLRALRGGSNRASRDSARGSAGGLQSSRARFDARAARVRRRPWLVAAWFGVTVALLAGGVWLVWLSPVLVAKSVRVVGVPAGDVSTIVGRASVPLGTPLVKIDTRAISRRVIGIAALAQVTVSRSYPGTILISARLRVPVLAVKNPQGQVQVVDSQGATYATVTAVPKGVPLVNTVENPPSMESMRAALAVLGVLSVEQRGQVTNVTVLGPNMVTFQLGTVAVVWGGASESELKVKVMTALLGQKGVGTIDVSAPRSPVTR